MIMAARLGHDDIVQLLLQHGADPHIGTADVDKTALHFACQSCNYTTVKALLDAGADPARKTKVSMFWCTFIPILGCFAYIGLVIVLVLRLLAGNADPAISSEGCKDATIGS